VTLEFAPSVLVGGRQAVFNEVRIERGQDAQQLILS
jgi:hypothetical protein